MKLISIVGLAFFTFQISKESIVKDNLLTGFMVRKLLECFMIKFRIF